MGASAGMYPGGGEGGASLYTGDFANESFEECATAPPPSTASTSTAAPPANDRDRSGDRAQSQPTQRIEVEREPAATDTDSLTLQTIAKMCDYIAEGVLDPELQSATDLAIARFGRDFRDPYSVAWTVFWFCKHRVKRVMDEAALFRLGEPDQADMLISPAVLIRMKDAAEDCDGFTMLAAAMLGVAQVEQCIATIACDPRDRSRWSHVFNMVRLRNGDWLPLDCSHGPGPGWMVPRNRIYRWQCWGLDGNPVDVAMPVRSNLNGYVYRGPRPPIPGYARRRFQPAGGFSGVGFGQCNVDAEGNVDCGDDGFLIDSTSLPVDTTGTSTQTSPISGVNPATGAVTGIPFNWNTFAGALATDAAAVAKVAELPAGASLLPNGTVVGAGQSLSSLSGLFSGSNLLLLLLLIGGIVIVSEAEKSK
jgi:hypothetical protein